MGEVDIYDFDKTVYNGDSSVDFWKFCLKKKPVIALLVPWQFMGFALMKLNILSGAKGKSMFFSFMRFVDGEDMVKKFWQENSHKINSWFKPENRERDAVVCSASPEFLLSDICRQYNAKLVATVCDIKSGRIEGENCRGEEKVIRLKDVIDIGLVNTVYSDSPKADAPIFTLGVKRIHVVSGERIEF